MIFERFQDSWSKRVCSCGNAKTAKMQPATTVLMRASEEGILQNPGHSSAQHCSDKPIVIPRKGEGDSQVRYSGQTRDVMPILYRRQRWMRSTVREAENGRSSRKRDKPNSVAAEGHSVQKEREIKRKTGAHGTRIKEHYNGNNGNSNDNNGSGCGDNKRQASPLLPPMKRESST